jgi:hypothetical protein
VVFDVGYVWLDVVFVPMFLAHIETMSPVPGLPGGYGQYIISADYTHSLIGGLILSVILAAPFAIRWSRRCGIVIGCVAFSHWLLDLIMHRRDMPLLPGNAGQLPKIGFGLWQNSNASIAAEFALVSCGALLYWRAAGSLEKSSHSDGRRGILQGFLVLIFGIVVLYLDATAIAG